MEDTMSPRPQRKPNMPGVPEKDGQNNPIGPAGDPHDMPIDEPPEERQRREDDEEKEDQVR
jgi:hypothetical protein